MRMALLSGAVLAAVATIVASQAAEPVKSQSSEVVTEPLTGDASREVRVFNVLLPPGADSGRHYHHGDQYTTVQEGEIHIDIDGKATMPTRRAKPCTSIRWWCTARRI